MYKGVEILTPADVQIIEDRTINIPIHFDESFRHSLEKRVNQTVALYCDEQVQRALGDQSFIKSLKIEKTVRQCVDETINDVVKQLVKEEKDELYRRIADHFDTDRATINLCRAILEKNKEIRKLKHELAWKEKKEIEEEKCLTER